MPVRPLDDEREASAERIAVAERSRDGGGDCRRESDATISHGARVLLSARLPGFDPGDRPRPLSVGVRLGRESCSTPAEQRRCVHRRSADSRTIAAVTALAAERPHIAEATGGFAIVNSNSPEASVDRMLAESGSYYLIGYSSPAPPNDGKHHRITVRIRVPDVEIRAREGYDSPGKPPRVPPETPLEVLSRAAIQTRGLTMRVVAIPAPLAAQAGRQYSSASSCRRRWQGRRGGSTLPSWQSMATARRAPWRGSTTDFRVSTRCRRGSVRGSRIDVALVSIRSAWRRDRGCQIRRRVFFESAVPPSMPRSASEDCHWRR